jgi:hypothetical protein
MTISSAYMAPGQRQTRGSQSVRCGAFQDGSRWLSWRRRIAQSVKRGDVVIVTTGWLIPFWAPRGETDGTPGALAIARALSIGLGARVVFITEETIQPVVAAGCLAAGLRVYDLEFLLSNRNLGEAGAVAIVGFTLDAGQAPADARTLLDQLQPAAVIATEKSGRNRNGVYHTGLGRHVGNGYQGGLPRRRRLARADFHRRNHRHRQ